jgi:hypothetical protein
MVDLAILYDFFRIFLIYPIDLKDD